VREIVPLEFSHHILKFAPTRSEPSARIHDGQLPQSITRGGTTMNSIVTQTPWSLVPRLQDDINRLFGYVNQSDSSSATATWIPSVDIHEYTDRFELYVDLPGVDPKNVELTLQEGVLTLSGQRNDIHTQGNGDAPQYRRTEREVGRFHRRFVLPKTVDGDKVDATGRDGVLTVTVPKEAKALPRRIQIAA